MPLLRFQHIGDERNQRDRSEELAAVVSLQIGELGDEVFVDTPEDVSGSLLQFLWVQRAQELPQNTVVQFLIFALGQGTAQVLVVGLDGLHGVDDGFGPIISIGE